MQPPAMSPAAEQQLGPAPAAKAKLPDVFPEETAEYVATRDLAPVAAGRSPPPALFLAPLS